MSKEEYLEQQAAAKKKAQVGSRGCWCGSAAGCMGDGWEWWPSIKPSLRAL